MARFYASLTPDLCDFIRRQHVFFTASAATDGRVNLSPKGMDTFRILAEDTVAYLDLTGSGNETAAHLLRDGRLTVMFCSFDEKPLILRLYGRGRVVRPRDAEWAELIGRFIEKPGQRQIVMLRVESVQTSCGFGVPRYELATERDTLRQWSDKKGPDGIREYWAQKNQTSIDGFETGLLGDADPR
jgi:hypothetical protein